MHRTERIGETLREEIAQIVSYELEDPRLMMVTGKAVSASMRLIEEPVISTRWVSCASAGSALSARLPPNASIRPVQTFVFLNIGSPGQRG